MMSGIRGKDTRPELTIRRALHRAGFRYRLHVKELPGKPDIVLPRYRVAILVHGCFWHRHECHLFKWPESRVAFWQVKLAGNHASDVRHLEALRRDGWRVLVIWECALKGRERLNPENLETRVLSWLSGKSGFAQIRGKADAASS
jgi:DNA mismatch endonuclease (patch repair protein)